MTATGLSEKVVADRVAWVRDMVAALRRVPLDSYDAFLSDDRNVAAAASYLRRALEALMDLGRHILAKGFGAAAPEYREISRRLLELGVLSPEQAGLMGELAAQGKAILFVSTYLTELLAVCDRIGVMSGGRLREIRPASEWTAESVMAIAVAK